MEIPIVLLSLGSLFITVVLVFMILIIISSRNYAIKRDFYYSKKLNDMENKISELQSTVIEKVADIFTHIQKIIK